MKRLGNACMRKRIVLAIGFVLIVLLAGCSIGVSQVNDSSVSLPEATLGVSLSTIPFTPEHQLDSVQGSSDDIVPWKLARVLAYLEFRSGMDQKGDWHDATLSESPVAIYDADSMPTFYEFIIHKDSNAVGTLVVYARKTNTSIVSHVLPFVRDYSTVLSKSSDYAQFNLAYPHHVLLGIPSKSGDAPSVLIDPNTGEAAELPESGETAEERYAIAMAMDSETLLNDYGTTHAKVMEQKRLHDEYQVAVEADTVGFWAEVDRNLENFLALDDAEIDAALAGTKGVRDEYQDHILYSEAKLRTRWNGWCVPSLLSWLYRMEHSSYYNGVYLPLHGDSVTRAGFGRDIDLYPNYYARKDVYADVSQYDYNRAAARATPNDDTTSYRRSWVEPRSRALDGGLYARLMELGNAYNKEGGVSRAGGNLNRMVRSITGNAHFTEWLVFPAALAPYRTMQHHNIYVNHKPVIVGGARIAKGSTHSYALVGTEKYTRVWTYNHKFLWFRWTSTVRDFKHQNYLVHDNGFVTSGKGLSQSYANEAGAGTTYNKSTRYLALPYWVNENNLRESRWYLFH